MGTHQQGPRLSRGIGFFCLVATWIGQPATSQDGDTIADKVLSTAGESLPETSKPDPSVNPPGLPERTPKDKTPLGVKVKVIRLVDHQDKADLNSSFAIREKVMVDGDFLLPDGLTEDLESEYIGKPFSLELLDRIIRFIIESYRETDYPLIDAYLPEQDITNGKLQIVIREAVLGEVKVEGAKHSRPEYLIKQVRLAPGDRVNTYVLEKDVEWMNTNPGRQVEIIYERGEADGTSDIILQPNESNAVASYINFGNTGLKATGENEWTMGYLNSNVLGSEQSIAYNFSGDYDFDNLNSHVAVYETPLPWRHRFEIVAAYVTSEVGGGTGDAAFDAEGENILALFNYKIPLPKLKRKHRQNASLSVDYKSTNSDILFGGTGLFSPLSVVLQGRLGYDITINDRDLPGYEAADEDEPGFSYTRFAVGMVGSPGNLVHGNSSADFEAVRPDSRPYYSYFTANIERLQQLPKDWSLILKLDTQLTGDRLITTEQMRAGGYRSVRGFDESLIRGDSGLQFSAEIASPPVPAFSKWSEKEFTDQINAYAFYDNAFLFSNELPGEGDLSQSIQGVGIGLNYQYNSRFRVRLTYGVNVYDEGVLGEVENDKLHFGVSTSF